MVNSSRILKVFPKVLKEINIPGLGKKLQGKVREIYFVGDQRILITTDRHTSFDVFLGLIPFKGAVLTLLSQFWFEKTKTIIPNHMIAVPDPNVMITKNCQPLPVEIVIRGYISGVSKTGLWYNYSLGKREIYGMKFPDGLKKNQKLPHPIITPTTKPEIGSKVHDEMLTKKEILKSKLVPKKLYEEMERVSLELFNYGTKVCRENGLILVDTKYEFGLYNGKLMLIDEIHTPDSARFWIAKSYKERFGKGLEPEYYDKEFLRLWYAGKGYRGDGPPPKMPKDLMVKLAKRYISVCEKLTGKRFTGFDYPIEKRITRNIKRYIMPEDKLTAFKKTREIAVKSLEKTLEKALSSKKAISEYDFREMWLKEIRKNKALFADGWYTPPPHGMVVLFGTDDNPERVSPPVTRPRKYWARKNVFLNRNGFIYVYASPVDRKTGVIGDFGLNIYLGSSPKIKKHLKTVYKVNQEIFKKAKEGTMLKDLNKLGMEIMKKKGVTNNILSLNDPAQTNFGHSIPSTFDDWSEDERKVLNKVKDWRKVSKVISKKRIFLNSIEKTRISRGCAFTIEPRPVVPGDDMIPTVWFHTVALFHSNGKKEFVAGFDKIFRITGMRYLLT